MKKCSDKAASVLVEKGVNTAESGKLMLKVQYKATARRGKQHFKNLCSYMISSSADLFKSRYCMLDVTVV